MSFDALEVSNQDGKPIAIYEFTQGSPPTNGRSWLFNSSDRPIVIPDGPFAGQVAAPEAISDGGIQISGGSQENEATITLPLSNAVAQLFNGTPPSTQIDVTIRRMHYEDNESPIYWIGFISSRKIPQEGQAQLMCNTLVATFTRAGLRLGYGRQCPHPLYAPTTCRAVKVPVPCVITALTGNSVTAAGFGTMPDGKFNGGYFEWPIQGTLVETRAIDQHTGTTVTILGITDGLSVGMTITAFIGCGHDRPSCDGDHANLPNYGGFAHLPGKSPFDGDQVF
jgi:uncharacterized phage protein (TIGR02218 family)